ncbi:hypothetical protein F4780DRAFT_791393 [Xylariomycetidae sp. FL0641]|nr:hypothetical protein F4780DRAFT_791393 [Xylariomycetidae sp. FL0641]
MRFQSPQLGALGVTFTALRAMQFIALIAIIGMSANFINEIVTEGLAMPDVLVGTLVVASISALYVAISYILYYDGLLPLLISGGIDMAFLIASVVVASTIGKPLPMLKCEILPEATSSSSSSHQQTFTMSVSSRSQIEDAIKYNNYLRLITTDQPHCYEAMTVWGLAIALAVLFAFSSIGCAGVNERRGVSDNNNNTPFHEKTTTTPGPRPPPSALGTRLLSPTGVVAGGGGGSRFPPPLVTPEAARRRPVLTTIAEDLHRPVTPIITVTNSNTIAPATTIVFGRSLTPARAPSPTEAFIPIVHQTTLAPPQPRQPPPLVVPPVPPIPGDNHNNDNDEEDDDNNEGAFTPITPASSSSSPQKWKGFKLNRASSHSPLDALGIYAARLKAGKSKTTPATAGEFDDTSPLSPATPKSPRKTFFGVLEGWWDLGLLERGRSLRRGRG